MTENKQRLGGLQILQQQRTPAVHEDRWLVRPSLVGRDGGLPIFRHADQLSVGFGRRERNVEIGAAKDSKARNKGPGSLFIRLFSALITREPLVAPSSPKIESYRAQPRGSNAYDKRRDRRFPRVRVQAPVKLRRDKKRSPKNSFETAAMNCDPGRVPIVEPALLELAA